MLTDYLFSLLTLWIRERAQNVTAPSNFFQDMSAIENFSMKLFKLIFLLRFCLVFEWIFLHEEGAMRAS